MDGKITKKKNRRTDHSQWETPAFAPSPGLDIVVDKDSCTGCNLCVLACPTDCLELDTDAKLAYVVRLDTCIVCYSCEHVCRPDCIDVQLEDKRGEEKVFVL